MGWVKNKGGVIEIGSGMKGGREPSWLFVVEVTTKSMRDMREGGGQVPPLAYPRRPRCKITILQRGARPFDGRNDLGAKK